MPFEVPSADIYAARPNADALRAQREKYIVDAIDSLITTRKKEIVAHPSRHFITLIQRELIRKSGTETYRGGQAAYEAAEDEYRQDIIAEKVFDYFGIKPGDYEALDAKLAKF